MPDFQPYIPLLTYAGLALVGLIALVIILRAFSRRSRGRKGMRLGVVEYCEIDETRRLVLLRRDDVEHLVMIGGDQDFLVEGNINGAQPVRQSSMMPTTPIEPQLAEEAQAYRPPRAPVFGAARRPVLRPVVSTSNEDDHS